MATVRLDHGEGGAASARLISELFLRHLGGPEVLEDAAVVSVSPRVALSTDSFVVKPLRFPGGDIGRLAVCGTVNDLAVMGAMPVCLSAAFVLEEGLDLALLEQIVASMGETARAVGAPIVTGDTKVVRRGEADGLFINTTGVGWLGPGVRLSAAACRPGDAVLVSGPIAEHGVAVLVAREAIPLEGDLASDCQPLHELAQAILAAAPGTRCMRDPTRGGLATALVEIAAASGIGVELYEDRVPVRRPVQAACDLLGLDPLYVPCEGRLLAVVPAAERDAALAAMQGSDPGRLAACVGAIGEPPGGVLLHTRAGGRRPLLALEGAQLPRIC